MSSCHAEAKSCRQLLCLNLGSCTEWTGRNTNKMRVANDGKLALGGYMMPAEYIFIIFVLTGPSYTDLAVQMRTPKDYHNPLKSNPSCPAKMSYLHYNPSCLPAVLGTASHSKCTCTFSVILVQQSALPYYQEGRGKQTDRSLHVVLVQRSVVFI